MNAKAIIYPNLIYILIALIPFAVLLAYTGATQNGAKIWADLQAKELARVINLARPGDVITIDINQLTTIAQKNNIPVSEFNTLVEFDNPKNQICIKLSRDFKSCYPFFNEVDVINPQVKFGAPYNSLTFEIAKTHAREEDNES